MTTNLDKYKSDLKKLVNLGNKLECSMEYECRPEEFAAAIKPQMAEKTDEFLTGLPAFGPSYQRWYSEAKALIRQLLPDRLDDFVRHYEKPKSRKEITFESYRIEDYLQGLQVTRGWEQEVVVSRTAGIPHMRQQIAILKAIEARFDSSLFDIRQLVTADLFDSEIDTAAELSKHRFFRAAGAVAGVVLEKHLGQVCDNHKIKISKKNPGIGDLNELLKTASIVDIPQWRFIQHLSDIRNLCDHDKAVEPTANQVNDLVSGVSKVIKTVF
jgi:hypothetical protein